MDFLPPLIGFLLSALQKNKALETMTSEALNPVNNKALDFWNKIKPKFLKSESDTALIEKIEKYPDDENFQGGLKYRLLEELQNPIFEKEVKIFLAEIDKLDVTNGNKKNEQINIKAYGDQPNIIVHSNVSNITNNKK